MSPKALRTTLEEGVAMVDESVAHLRGAGLQVLFDAEHFFDGYKANPAFALRVLEAAAMQGAQCLVLCDTNGGSLPHEVQRITSEVVSYFDGAAHRASTPRTTSGCAVANTVAAVRRRRLARAGNRQRLRRAHRQREPDDRDPGPDPEDGCARPCPRGGWTASRR